MAHALLLGSLWCWSASFLQVAAEFDVQRGEPLTLNLSHPAATAAPDVPVETRPMDPLTAESLREELQLPERPEPPPPQPVVKLKPAEQLRQIERQPEAERRRPRLADLPLAKAESVPDHLEIRPQPPAASLPKLQEATPEQRKQHPADELVVDVQALPIQTAAVAGANVDQLPRKLTTNAPPEYPLDALLAGVQGRVMIRATISAAGLVAAARIETSSSSASLDQAALAAVRRWRFVPAQREGAAVEHEVLLPVNFSIRSR